MKLFLLLVLSLSTICGYSQVNIDSIGHVDFQALHNTKINEVWGYVDEFGNEYAIVGAESGTSVVDISDPANPVEVFWEPGMQSIWRDMKTFGDYAYVTTEAQNGLLIIDLSPLPSSTNLQTYYYTGPTGNEWQSAHNLYADSSGYLYIFGANRGNGGVIMLDVNNLGTPTNPVEVGTFDNWYVHDGYALRDTLFCGHISDGFMSIVDVTDKANPVLLGTKNTPSDFTHNLWATSDNNYVFTTDELASSFIGAYDVSDPANIIELDRIQSSPGVGTIPHNTHVYQDQFIVTSHYTDGVVIHDITYPYNMVEVGDYDTYPTQQNNYDGCWGAYPFLPSGLLLASDRTEGLFILSPNYTQAAYIEGTVTDASTLNPIQFVDVTIVGVDQFEETRVNGFYATGVVQSGTYDVIYSKVGYFPDTISVSLTNGVITTQDVQLVPIPPYSLTVTVLEAGTNLPIDNANISLEATLIKHEGTTNALGEENFTLFYQEDYEVIAGKWGYVSTCSEQLIDNSTGAITVFLEKGIYDDFSFDFGWSTTGSTASHGLWEIGVPNPTGLGSAPSADYWNDCGNQCYVTGNLANDSGFDDDVRNGSVFLRSPIMDLTGMSDPYLFYSRWFFTHNGANQSEDSLIVRISNGTDVVVLEQLGFDPPSYGQWHDVSFRISDFISLTSTMQVTYVTADFAGSENVTEAGLDRFQITEGSILGEVELDQNNVTLYPNPTDGILQVSGISANTQFNLFTIGGQKLMSGQIVNNQIDLSSLSSGVYFIQIEEEMHRINVK